MKTKYSFIQEELNDFLDRAGKATYAGGGKPEKNPERPGFIEYAYEEKDFVYRDSYVGFYRSRGMEVARYQGKPVWTSMYGGGMTKGNKELANECFKFLKKALRSPRKGFISFRGPRLLQDGDWKYAYHQEGDRYEFWGYEEIFYKEKLVFFHRVIGGIVEDRIRS